MTRAVMNYEDGALAFAFIEFVVWASAFVATPIAQFKTPNTGCYTMWGYRDYCGRVAYNTTGVRAFGCQQRASTMSCAAAFGVISTVASFAALVLAVLMNTRLSHVVPVLPLVVICACIFVTTLISWACVAGVKTMTMCGTKFDYPLTAGFGFMVASCGLQAVALLVLCLFAVGDERRDVSDEDEAEEGLVSKRAAH